MDIWTRLFTYSSLLITILEIAMTPLSAEVASFPLIALVCLTPVHRHRRRDRGRQDHTGTAAAACLRVSPAAGGFWENPFLSDFYADRARYALQTRSLSTQPLLPATRAAPQILAEGRNLISDYTFRKSAYLHASTWAATGWRCTPRFTPGTGGEIPPPDLIVYLRASPDVLMQRITFPGSPIRA